MAHAAVTAGGMNGVYLPEEALSPPSPSPQGERRMQPPPLEGVFLSAGTIRLPLPPNPLADLATLGGNPAKARSGERGPSSQPRHQPGVTSMPLILLIEDNMRLARMVTGFSPGRTSSKSSTRATAHPGWPALPERATRGVSSST